MIFRRLGKVTLRRQGLPRLIGGKEVGVENSRLDPPDSIMVDYFPFGKRTVKFMKTRFRQMPLLGEIKFQLAMLLGCACFPLLAQGQSPS